LKAPSKLAGLFVLLQDVKVDSRVSLVEDERWVYGFFTFTEGHRGGLHLMAGYFSLLMYIIRGVNGI
jgi:hypothetical protein